MELRMPIRPPEPSNPAGATVELQNPPSEPEEVESDAAPRQIPNAHGGFDAGVSELATRELESRIAHAFNARIDSVVLAFNEILAQGLGEVQAKYEVGLRDIVNDCRRGRRFGPAFSDEAPFHQLRPGGFRSNHPRTPRAQL